MYYDVAAGKVTNTPSVEGMEPFLVYQEIKIYEPWLSYKDFAMIRVGDNYVTNPPAVGRMTSANADGTVYGDGALTAGAKIPHGNYQAGYRMEGIAPRLVKTNVGDIYTTNMVEVGTSDSAITYQEKDILTLKKTDGNTLVLSKTGDINTITFVVAKVYTMPDGQPGLKIQRIK